MSLEANTYKTWAEDVARPALAEALIIAIAQDGAKGLKMRAVLRKAIDAYPQPEKVAS